MHSQRNIKKGGIRRQQLLDDLHETIKCWKLREEELDRILWRTRFARSYAPVVRQTRQCMYCALALLVVIRC